MEHNYNFTTNELWTQDYIDATSTNPRLRGDTRRVVRDPNTLAGGLPFDGQDLNLMDYSLVNIEQYNFNNNDSYYQYLSTSFVPGGTGQPPVLQPRPLGLHGFDHNLPSNQPANHSITNRSLRNTSYQHNVLDFSGYLNPSHAGFNSRQLNLHNFDPNLSNKQSLNHSMVNGLPMNTAYQHAVPGSSGHVNSSNARFSPTLPLAQHDVASSPIPTNGSVSKPGPHFCSHGCGKYFTRKKDMERHAGKHLPPTLSCPVVGCDKRFYRKDKLKEHMRKHGGVSLTANGAIM